MATIRFSRQEFESALPVGFWMSDGFVTGEYQYRMEVSKGVYILIRSSVHLDGYAAETGADSIRCWIVDETGAPLAAKLKAYTTRVIGWESRLREMLRSLWRKAKSLKSCCGQTMRQFAVKKEGPNKGREFRKCSVCGAFEWVEA